MYVADDELRTLILEYRSGHSDGSELYASLVVIASHAAGIDPNPDEVHDAATCCWEKLDRFDARRRRSAYSFFRQLAARAFCDFRRRKRLVGPGEPQHANSNSLGERIDLLEQLVHHETLERLRAVPNFRPIIKALLGNAELYSNRSGRAVARRIAVSTGLGERNVSSRLKEMRQFLESLELEGGPPDP